MNKKKFYVLILLFFVIFNSCSKDVKEKIIGEWKAKKVVITNFDEILDANARLMGKISDEKRQELIKSSTSMANDFQKESMLIFHPDNSVQANERKGTWQLLNNDSIIVLNLQEELFDFKINKITTDSLDLMLLYDMGNEVTVKVHTVFVKINQK